jgi:hypothetical protein
MIDHDEVPTRLNVMMMLLDELRTLNANFSALRDSVERRNRRPMKPSSVRPSGPEEAMVSLMDIWSKRYPNGATAHKAALDSVHDVELLAVLDSFNVVERNGTASGRKLGYKIKIAAGRRLNRRRFEKIGTLQGRAKWCVLADGEDVKQ